MDRSKRIDEAELIAGARIRSSLLTGAEEEAYVRRLVQILRAARLNTSYPDARAMRAHVEALSPQVHKGLYGGVEINLDSGLPTYKEWTRVQTDVALAADQLVQLGDRRALEPKARRNPESIHAKQLRKIDYYTKLRGRPTSSLGDMHVALRRVIPEERTAWFSVLLDKLDASGLFVRYTIDLAQQSGAWSKPVVTLNDETAEHTEAFQSLIYKFTSLDAEFTFAKLSALEGLTIERVFKGTVGPFYFAPEMAPPMLRDLVASQPGGFLAMFGLEMIADDIAEDRDNDPVRVLFDTDMMRQARENFEVVRDEHKSFRDRKFVTARAMVPAVRGFCEELGTNNIVYGV